MSHQTGCWKDLFKAHALSKICMHNFAFHSTTYPDLLKLKVHFQFFTCNMTYHSTSRPLSLTHLVKMAAPGRCGTFIGDNLWTWNPSQILLFKEHGERELFRFSYLYLLFWWASLCTLLSLDRPLGFGRLGPIHLRGQDKPLASLLPH